nr:hypothetical protein [Pseudonocardia sp. MH-G8]
MSVIMGSEPLQKGDRVRYAVRQSDRGPQADRRRTPLKRRPHREARGVRRQPRRAGCRDGARRATDHRPRRSARAQARSTTRPPRRGPLHAARPGSRPPTATAAPPTTSGSPPVPGRCPGSCAA